MSDANTTPALNADALYRKSQVYIRRALERKANDDVDEYQLWASLALELLGKSTLAAIHPSLVADPTHYQSLFAASGINVSTDVKTITAKTLYERIRHIIKAFDATNLKFCNEIALRRNAELHSGATPFRAMSLESWEAQYWFAVDIILVDGGDTVDEWLGADHSSAPAAILQHAKEARQQSIGLRLERHKTEFFALKKSEQELAFKRSVTGLPHDYSSVFSLLADALWDTKCPSCEGRAFVAGVQVEEDVVDTYPGDYGPWEMVEKTYAGEQFRCPVCSLRLDGYEELEIAGIETEHTETHEREMEYEPEYGND